MYESYVKRMSFSSGTGGGLGGFQLICTAGCLSPITCTQERPFSIASNKSPYLRSSQSGSMGGCLCRDCIEGSGWCVKLVPSARSNFSANDIVLLPMPRPYFRSAINCCPWPPRVHVKGQQFSNAVYSIIHTAKHILELIELCNWGLLSSCGVTYFSYISAWVLFPLPPKIFSAYLSLSVNLNA